MALFSSMIGVAGSLDGCNVGDARFVWPDTVAMVESPSKEVSGGSKKGC